MLLARLNAPEEREREKEKGTTGKPAFSTHVKSEHLRGPELPVKTKVADGERTKRRGLSFYYSPGQSQHTIVVPKKRL
jgi:hypothetical protein